MERRGWSARVTDYLVRRVLQAIPVVLLASLLVFLLLRVIPGDPAQILAGPDAPPEVVEALRREMGVDRPWPVQYLTWMQDAVRGDLGSSLSNGYPVSELIAQRLPATVELTVAAMVLALAIALPAGIAAGLRPRSRTDFGLTFLATLSLAVPNFWLGILFVLFFSLTLNWLPSGGRVPLTQDVGDGLRHLILPAVTLSLAFAAEFTRFLRTGLLEVIEEDYIRTARAKGLRQLEVVGRHALSNAIVPLVTVLGVRFGQLLGGAVIVEAVFSWPGVGRLLLMAIQNRDYTVVQGTLLVLVLGFVAINLATDLLYGFLDPRIRVTARA